MKDHNNPPGLATPAGFSHVVRTNRKTTLVVAGQVAYDAQGQIVGAEDFEQQVRQVYSNIRTALRQNAADMVDLVKTTIFVRDLTPEKIAVIRAVRKEFLSDEALPASTLVGVQALAKPQLMLEIEAVAMVD
ncbi:RidA family protein [Ottowia thiooxydans]|uniref:Enamine deaminase RidA (YjgF/YER057c/UK114 family) n=1 Tax=Ottowia thiooxydans TaxID=219182 RepID=A0ABV2Q9S9_9BURK